MNEKLRQRGFTAIEMMISIALLGILTYVTFPMIQQTFSAGNKQETISRLKMLRQTMVAAYKVNALEMDGEPGAQIVVGGAVVLTSSLTATADTFAWANKYSALSPALLYKDGYGMPWRVFVSVRQENNVNGTLVYSHKIAFVSGGRNGRVDSGTGFDEATGQLTLQGDDMGDVVDGFDLQNELYEVTRKRISTLASAYQALFQTRFQGNANRDLNVNYFTNASRGSGDAAMFDTGGPVANTGGGEVAAKAILGPVLGLTSADFEDAYGHPILVDNSSDAVRTPDNSNSSMQAPPYTVVLKAGLPGGGVVTQAVIGTY